jgi:adenine phosphoribosyltransferase
MDKLKDIIRSIPDFPVKNVTFRDISTLLQDGEAFKEACDRFYEHYKNRKIDKIAGIEARGFIFGAVLAYHLKVGFIPVRKKGKLPYKTISEKYSLEYGTAELEIHEDAITKGEKVVIIDDLIATGGTVEAAIRLVERLGGEVEECGFIIELPFLKGRDLLKNRKIFSMISFEGE